MRGNSLVRQAIQPYSQAPMPSRRSNALNLNLAVQVAPGRKVPAKATGFALFRNHPLGDAETMGFPRRHSREGGNLFLTLEQALIWGPCKRGKSPGDGSALLYIRRRELNRGVCREGGNPCQTHAGPVFFAAMDARPRGHDALHRQRIPCPCPDFCSSYGPLSRGAGAAETLASVRLGFNRRI